MALGGLPFDGRAGAIVTDDDGDRYILSCRHVLDGSKGDRVVLRQAGSDDRWIARLTQNSAWNLGINPQPANKTDFALARILDDVASNPALPSGVPPFSCDLQPPSPNLPVAPLSNTGYSVSVSRQVPLSNVQFPFGQIALSGMWLAHSPDPSIDLAESGDSGSLFVFVGQDKLYPAAIAVAVTAEYREWIMKAARSARIAVQQSCSVRGEHRQRNNKPQDSLL